MGVKINTERPISSKRARKLRKRSDAYVYWSKRLEHIVWVKLND
jgi:hypothetical protein